MELLLKEAVKNLGDAGELVVVKPGYGRNYLIPQGKAILATASVKKMHEENIRQRAHKEEKIIADAQALAAKLEGITLKIGAKVGENGKIFGSVNSIQIADGLKAEGFDIDRKHIVLKEDHVKTVGSYEATIKLHKTVAVTLPFEVVGE
jgi:large subunit ribosomal protein L9